MGARRFPILGALVLALALSAIAFADTIYLLLLNRPRMADRTAFLGLLFCVYSRHKHMLPQFVPHGKRERAAEQLRSET